MPIVEDGQHWVIESVGLILIVVGASKLLYDVVIWNNFLYWKIYMAIMLIGGVATGYVKIGQIAEKIIGRL